MSDYYCFSQNITEYYTIENKDKPFIKQIIAIYFYDAESHTYCCEITPSYLLENLSGDIIFSDDCPDDIKDELLNKYIYSQEWDDAYMHCSDVKSIKNQHHYGPAENSDEVREYYQGNPVF